MQKKIKYTKAGMFIHLPTAIPANLHSQLLRAITVVLKQHLITPVEARQDAEAMISLADLQTTLLPNAEQLEKMFE